MSIRKEKEDNKDKAGKKSESIHSRKASEKGRKAHPKRRSSDDSLFDDYYSLTSSDRFANFSQPQQIKHDPEDYFRTRYGYTSGSKKEKEIKEKPKRSTDEKLEKSYYKNTPKPKELTRTQRKKRNKIKYVVTFFIMVGLAFFFSFNVLFKTNEILVENADSVPYTESEIIDASGLKLNGTIFTARKKAAVKKIVDTLPYIENAEITFKIPAARIIKIEPAIPSYEVAVNGGYAIISEKGRVLEINPKQLSEIPLLKGLKVTDTEVGKYISFEKESTKQILDEVIKGVNDNNVPLIYGIDISNAANIKLNYDNRITIHIGLPEDVGYKLRTAMAIINGQLAPTEKGDLDVSLANGDKKASYFTPIYSNTVSADTRTTSSVSAGGSEDDDYEPTTGVRKANSSKTDEEQTSSQNDEDGENEDNGDNEDYYYEEEYSAGDETGDY